MNNSIENAAQSIKERGMPEWILTPCRTSAAMNAASCAKVIPYAENKSATGARPLDLGHKHEVNRDATARDAASRENAVSMIGDHA